jgi:RHS repeat-associated protein
MEPALSTLSAPPLVPAWAELSENSRPGSATSKPALHPGHDGYKSTTALGLQATLFLNGARSRCPGKERDAESGLDNFGARYYGSNMGRMMSPDPMGGDMTNPQSLNRYAYVLNNPLRFTDPTGLYVCKDGQDCSAFEKTLAGLRNSKNADVARAANAYGAAGEKNGVTVGFADLSKSGQDGVTKSSLGQGADGKLQAQSDVTINSKASGAGFDAAVGHEGSHVADAQAVVGSIVVDEHGNFTVGNNITRYQSEQRAYGVTNAILSSEGVNANEGCDGCNLGQNTMQGQVPGVVNRIMNSGTNYMSGGQHMGPKNQGGSVVNGLDVTPKASVPQVPK